MPVQRTVQRCVRCGTPRRGDAQVCMRCETPFEEDVEQALPRPAAPSQTQSHGTLVALLLCGFVVLGALLWLSVRDVGPFTARIVSTERTGSGAKLTVEVSNGGDKAGRGRCLVGRVHTATDAAQPPFQFLSRRVPAKGTITQSVDVPLTPGVAATGVTC